MHLENQAFTTSSEDEHQVKVELELDTLFSLSSWKTWKISVERDLNNLRKRVLELEQTKSSGITKKLTSAGSYAFANAGDDGCCGLRTSVRLIRSRKTAMFQCTLLVIFIAVISTFGITEFIRAARNVEAEFKPQKKYKTIDYGKAVSDEPYEMPYVYIYFGCYPVTYNFSSERINETLDSLLQSQNYFLNSSYIIYGNSFDSHKNALPIEEAKAFYEEEKVHEHNFYGYFRLKLSDPEPTLGPFAWTVKLDLQALTLDWTVWLHDVHVSVSTETTDDVTWSTIYVPSDRALLYDMQISLGIGYVEKVLRTYSKEYLRQFTTSLAWLFEKYWQDYSYDFDSPAGMVELTFKRNLVVESWEEYVEYDYYDWFVGMGGLISICSTLFFKGAYYSSVIFGDKGTMGILPPMKLVFKNYETVHLLKQQEE